MKLELNEHGFKFIGLCIFNTSFDDSNVCGQLMFKITEYLSYNFRDCMEYCIKNGGSKEIDLKPHEVIVIHHTLSAIDPSEIGPYENTILINVMDMINKINI